MNDSSQERQMKHFSEDKGQHRTRFFPWGWFRYSEPLDGARLFTCELRMPCMAEKEFQIEAFYRVLSGTMYFETERHREVYWGPKCTLESNGSIYTAQPILWSNPSQEPAVLEIITPDLNFLAFIESGNSQPISGGVTGIEKDKRRVYCWYPEDEVKK